MKIKLILLFLITSTFTLLANDAKGPLVGKNYYIPFVPYYSFPGLAAAPGEKHMINFSMAIYFIQDIVTEFHLIGNDLVKERFIDYEGSIFEPTVSFNLLAGLEIGLTTRFHTYYGGLWDSVIEGFHDLFGFPNGGREYYPLNDLYINLHTSSGIDLSLTEPVAALGDTDFYIRWSFLSLNFMDMALFSAIKFPTGSPQTISGSGFPDLGFSLLVDFHIFKWLSVYIQNGIIIPGQLFINGSASPEPMYSALASIEFIVSPHLSIISQLRFNTSPILKGSVIPENISYSVKLHQPMTNILAGVVLQFSGYRFQFDFEEDAFTNNGADLIINFTVSKSFKLSF